MAEQLSLFHLDDERPSFEDLGRTNGGKFWFARDFMRMLGYESFQSFQKAINKAIATCTALNISVAANFAQVQREVEGEQVADFKLTRFACYLTAVNGDVRKPEVAQAQAYFVTMAEGFRLYVQNAEDVERVQIREEVTDRERALSGVAHEAGVQHYQFFQNKGYLGLYNMNLSELRDLKKVPSDRSPLDFMGKAELAANLFRITQTEEKIRNDQVKGQAALEKTAFTVGKTVRKTMIEISGVKPETLPTADDIRSVKGDLKRARRGFDQLDKPKRALGPAPDKEK